jgi:phosphomannomutase
MSNLPKCFKPYDIRGRVPEELDNDLAQKVGHATAIFTGGKKFVVGHDCRTSSRELADAVIAGLCDAGADVLDIGLCGTEEIYHATFARKMDGGIMVTASHNPIGWNGMKLVREDSRPISSDTGLNEIGEMAVAGNFPEVATRGTVEKGSVQDEYIEFLMSFVDSEVIKPMKVVVNAGNGCAGPTLDLLEPQLPFNMIKVNHEPDGTFPNGVPNPLLQENREMTASIVREHGADVGIAWDGDFDRCFFFDETGEFIEGYYLVGLLAETMLHRSPGAAIVHDPRMIWNTIKLVEAAGGKPLVHKTGHAFIKERMRSEDAVYGGEMSAHHYFRDFAYCDSGMLPWILVLQEICKTGKPLSELVGQMQKEFPASGEINRRIENPSEAIARVEAHFGPDAIDVNYVDGLSIEYPQWRFSLRMSNTEPVVRLNVESRGDVELMQEKTAILVEMLES